MALFIMGLVTCFNFVIIIWKYKHKRYMDTAIDFTAMAIICWLFSGSFNALVVGMVASLGISIFLFFNPITLNIVLGKQSEDDEDEYEDEYED